MRCFVPNCKSYTTSKRNKNGEKICFVRAPRTEEELILWREVVPQEKRILNSKDSLCEFHFDPEEIIKTYEEKLNDGTIATLKRGRAKLKKNVVPSIFPPKKQECFVKLDVKVPINRDPVEVESDSQPQQVDLSEKSGSI